MSIFKRKRRNKENTDLVPSLRESIFNDSIKDIIWCLYKRCSFMGSDGNFLDS